MTKSYQIKLPHFEGPFDLLLFFIERDELDIYDIPIAQLTDEFLAYIHERELINMDVASDFILMAATLMQIKAKMLLPRRDLSETGEELDPRQALVEKLLEYKQYKAVAQAMQTLEEVRANLFKRGNASEEVTDIAARYETEAELEQLSLYRLLAVFNRVLERYERRETEVKVEIVVPPFSIETERTSLEDLFKGAKSERMNFENLFAEVVNRVQAIVRFLALLELLQEGHWQLLGGDWVNQFWIAVEEEG